MKIKSTTAYRVCADARTTSGMTDSTEVVTTVSQDENRYGNPEPQIEIRLPTGMSHRYVSAELHKLAAQIELATPARERWTVQTENFYDARGRVYLELADATPAEAARAMAMLEKLSAGNAAARSANTARRGG